MDYRQGEAAAAFAKARQRASRALERAVQIGEAAASAERCSRQGPAHLSETMTRLAAIQRSSQQRLLAVARLNAAYAWRLRSWMEQPGDCRAAAFLAALADVCGASKVVLVLAGHEQEALVAASDTVARAAHELEGAYAEGPSRDAVARCAPVRASGGLAAMWPRYGPAVNRLGIHAVSAAPLRAAPLCAPGHCLGSVTALDAQPDGRGARLRADQLAQALVGELLSGDDAAYGDAVPIRPLFDGGQALVYQAAGMVAAESGLNVSDALALIRARAFADSQLAEAIAAQIISRQIQLTFPG